LKDALQNEYLIIEAENGQLGYEQAKQHQPDLIISDVMMPVMNGVEFCKKLKTDPSQSYSFFDAYGQISF
jgi:CheY-like chemotaxis protein